jgi:hypothetical protein
MPYNDERGPLILSTAIDKNAATRRPTHSVEFFAAGPNQTRVGCLATLSREATDENTLEKRFRAHADGTCCLGPPLVDVVCVPWLSDNGASVCAARASALKLRDALVSAINRASSLPFFDRDKTVVIAAVEKARHQCGCSDVSCFVGTSLAPA